jgi:hypothetical protein
MEKETAAVNVCTTNTRITEFSVQQKYCSTPYPIISQCYLSTYKNIPV